MRGKSWKIHAHIKFTFNLALRARPFFMHEDEHEAECARKLTADGAPRVVTRNALSPNLTDFRIVEGGHKCQCGSTSQLPYTRFTCFHSEWHPAALHVYHKPSVNFSLVRQDLVPSPEYEHLRYRNPAARTDNSTRPDSPTVYPHRSEFCKLATSWIDSQNKNRMHA